MKNLKPNTKRSNETTARLWQDFIKKKGVTYERATTLDAYHFFDYISHRKGIDGKKAANGTVHARIKTMRKIYQVLLSEGLVKTNIFQTALIKLRHPKENMKRQTQSIEQSLVNNLLSYKPKTIKERQAVCLIALMYAGGLRISEALKLQICDIRHSSKGTLYLLLKGTKNGTDAKQPLPDWCYEYLTKQVTLRSLTGGKNLFVSYAKDGTLLSDKLDVRTASRHTKKIFLILGLENHSNHSLRKSSINYLVERQYPVVDVQKFARHQSLLSTQAYINEVSDIESNLALKIVVD